MTSKSATGNRIKLMMMVSTSSNSEIFDPIGTCCGKDFVEYGQSARTPLYKRLLMSNLIVTTCSYAIKP
jgi:hypothetical protein